MLRPCEHLSRRQRQATPPAFSDWLIRQVMERTGAAGIAALWCARDSTYYRHFPIVEVWGRGRDARLYNGPHPIIAHPPCGQYGKYRSHCYHSRLDGRIAMELVHEWGGVVEQPLGSELFSLYGKDGTVEKVVQSQWGHPSKKETLLYWV